MWGEQANRDVCVSRCPATAGEPIRVGPAWGYGTVGSLLVRGVRTVSSCGRPGRDPGREYRGARFSPLSAAPRPRLTPDSNRACMDFESIASAAGLVSRVVHRRMTVRVDSAGILHVLGGQPFTWGPSSEWRRPDLNRRSLGYEPSGLPSFPTPQRYAEVSNPAHPALETRLRPARVTDSPCLLVKGTDCAGVTRARGACGGPGLVCRAVSAGTICPAYPPRALCSPIPVAGRRPEAVLSAACKRPRQSRMTPGNNVGPGNRTATGAPARFGSASPWGGGFRHAIIPRANRAGGRGSFWCYQTRASDLSSLALGWGPSPFTKARKVLHPVLAVLLVVECSQF